MARRVVVMFTGALVALLVLVGGASAQVQYPPGGSNLQTDRTQARPGEPITVTGAGFLPASTVTITFDDAVVLGTTHVRENGTFSIEVTIPANASPGSHTLAATGTGADGTPRRITSAVEVLGTAAARGGTLPRTGSGITTSLVASAALLIGAGSAAVVGTRRRPRLARVGISRRG
ncbi:MAG: hypothetical protein KY458_14515 [Actinobacteria bacterium]|nr:hypothetical protein [Actinomycetota bacterium]